MEQSPRRRTRVKGTPRRRGVLAKPCKRLRPAARRLPSWPKNKNLLPTFLHRKVTPAGQACQPSPSGDFAPPLGEIKLCHQIEIPYARVYAYIWVRDGCAPGPRAGEKSHRTAENLPPKVFCPNREQIFVSLLQSRQKSCTMESEYHHFGRKLHGHREKSKGNRPRPQR